MKYQKTALFGVVFVVSMGFAAPAYAYLDPGTTGMILQLAIGSIVGALVAVKLYWYRFKAFFLRRGKASEAAQVANKARGSDQ